MGEAPVEIALTVHDRLRSAGSARQRKKSAQGLARQAQFVLFVGDGLDGATIAARLDAHPDTIGKWRQRRAAEGLAGLHEEPRVEAPRRIDDAKSASTREETSADTARWHLRSSTGAALEPRWEDIFYL